MSDDGVCNEYFIKTKISVSLWNNETLTLVRSGNGTLTVTRSKGDYVLNIDFFPDGSYVLFLTKLGAIGVSGAKLSDYYEFRVKEKSEFSIDDQRYSDARLYRLTVSEGIKLAYFIGQLGDAITNSRKSYGICV